MQLFKQRGWTTFIADRLVFRVLLLANLGVAAMTGLVCMLGGWMYQVQPAAMQVLFWVGFFVGLYVSQTILFVVESATRTTMVLFAESATEFAEVHTELYDNMKEGWKESYPEAWDRAPAIATPVV